MSDPDNYIIFTMSNIGNLYHWQSKNIGQQELIPWSNFFDIKSLQKYVPVIEMYQFMEGMIYFCISY